MLLDGRAGPERRSYAIEIRLDDERVGELTAIMSARYRSYVEGGQRAHCEAVLTHGDREYQIALRLSNAN